jgi:hypothetical protein
MFRPLVPALRLTLEFGLIQASLKVLSSESLLRTIRDPLNRNPRVQFHLNSTFPGREITVRSGR